MSDPEIILHRYLVRVRNEHGYTELDTLQLLIQFRKEVEQFRGVVKNLRVSENAVEFDLYTLDDNSRIESLEKLGKNFGDVLTARSLDFDQNLEDKGSVIKETKNLFNQQRYWESHETLEQLWRKEVKGPEKDVQQGVILVASAMVHFQKNETDVCLGMMPRAITKLDCWHQSQYYGINVGELKLNLQEMLKSKKVVPFEI